MDIKKEIKLLLIQKGLNMSEAIKLLNEKHNKTETLQNLSGKLSRNTLKFEEAEQILDVLGCEFSIISKPE